MPSVITPTRRPLWLGLALTPLITPLVFIAAYYVYFTLMGYDRPGLSWAASLAFSYVFGVPLGYLAIGLLGWPLLIKLQHWHKLTIGYVCTGAGAIGILAFLAFAKFVGNDHSTLHEMMEQLVIGLVMGLIAGLIFCVVTGVPLKRGRGDPDRRSDPGH